MRKLLVPTDFSENAEKAYPYALKIAAKTGSKVTFWLTIEEPFDFAVRVDEKMKSIADYADNKFHELLNEFDEIPEYAGVDIDYHITHGKTVTGILKGIEQTKADWVVMGTKGSTGLKKLLFGSIASRVVSESPVPVLVIPNQSRFDAFKKIVFTTEYQDNDLNLLHSVIEFASFWNSEIKVVHISKEKSLKSEIKNRGFRELVNEELKYEQIECSVIYADDFFEGISIYQDPSDCSLLVMGRYDLDFLKELLDYSETKAMSFYSRTPLLVIPANI